MLLSNEFELLKKLLKNIWLLKHYNTESQGHLLNSLLALNRKQDVNYETTHMVYTTINQSTNFRSENIISGQNPKLTAQLLGVQWSIFKICLKS